MSDARETLERMIRQREAWLDEKCPHYYDPEPDECICSQHADWSIERDAISEVLAENERLRAITNSGHSDDCGGMDTSRGECECGWLQQEGAHAYITRLEARIEAALALIERYLSLPGCPDMLSTSLIRTREALKGE